MMTSRLLIITLASLVVLGCDSKEKAQQQAVEAKFAAAQVEHAKIEILELRTSVDMYRLQKAECPKGMAELVAAGIRAKANKDPWGNEYVFVCPGEHGEVDIVSPGKDGELGTADDIQSWTLPGGGE